MPPARMPQSVKVGPHTYRVLRRPASQMKDHGLCDWNQVQIFVRSRLRKSKAQEVLLHEVLHACTYPNMACVARKSDEDFVDATAPTLLQVLQENPDLLLYLTQ